MSPSSESALFELKRQAKVLRKSVRSGSQRALSLLKFDQPEGLQHKHYLLAVAREAGFQDWQHAHRILSGQGTPHDDYGTLWHPRKAGGFLNEWFADLDQARASLALAAQGYLLPFRTQFSIVGGEYIRHLGLDAPYLPAVGEAGRDLVAIYGTALWHNLVRMRLRAIFSEFH